MRAQPRYSLSQRLRRLAVACAGIAAALSFSAYATGAEVMLDKLRWQARVLLVFSAEAGDTRAKKFLATADQSACALGERDLVLGHLDPNADSFIGDGLVSKDDAAVLREKYRIGPSDFRVLLIGKDGGVKANYRDAPELDEVFALIDGMPMRRREARNRSDECID